MSLALARDTKTKPGFGEVGEGEIYLGKQYWKLELNWILTRVNLNTNRL